jgi:SAM-dependent methyltransferase
MAPQEDLLRGIAPEALRYLERSCALVGLSRRDLRVLDFGCGRGEAVLALHALGYAAWGVDIDALQIARGQRELTEAGFDGPALLRLIEENTRLPFADAAFDYVFSMEVFEHVRILRQVCLELARVLAPGGYGFHIFRAPRSWQEQHFFMPFVHWLPKNSLRRYAILAYSRLGVGLPIPDLPDTGWRARGEFLYGYSVEQTFYRRPERVANALRHAGLDVCYVATNHRRLQRVLLLAWLLNVPAVQRIATWGIMTLRVANLLTRKPDPAQPAPSVARFDGWHGVWLPAFEHPPARRGQEHAGVPHDR